MNRPEEQNAGEAVHGPELTAQIRQILGAESFLQDTLNVQLSTITIPSQDVDGDFFELVPHNNQSLDVIMGDVMGKGFSAALLGAMVKGQLLRALNLLPTSPQQPNPPPKDVVAQVNASVGAQLATQSRYVALLYARFNLLENQLDFVDCGHAHLLHFVQKTGHCLLRQGVNMPLGFDPDERLVEVSTSFDPGDVFVFYSDGISEARNPHGEFFGVDRLRAVVQSCSGLPPDQVIMRLRTAVSEHIGTPVFRDDFTCVAVRIAEPRRDQLFLRTRLEITSDLRNLGSVRQFVEDLYRKHPLLDDASEEKLLELAANEVASNIMRHAYDGRTDQPIQLEGLLTPHNLRMVFHHWGRYYQPPEDVREPDDDLAREGGWGLFIIDQCVDEVQYVQGADGRNSIILDKAIKSKEGEQAMKPTVEVINNISLVTVQEKTIDASNVQGFKQEIHNVLQPGMKAIFDIGRVDFVDSSGLGAILSCMRQLTESGGDLKLAGVTKPVRAILELVRFHRILEIYNTREEALKAFKA